MGANRRTRREPQNTPQARRQAGSGAADHGRAVREALVPAVRKAAGVSYGPARTEFRDLDCGRAADLAVETLLNGIGRS